MSKATVVIKKFLVRDREFVICKNEEGFYLAIEDKYINSDGTLNTKLYGHQMSASKDLNECLNTTKNHVEIDYLLSKGHSRAEAFAIIFNAMDRLEDLKKIFDGIEEGVNA